MLKGYGLKSYLQAGGGGGRVICNLGRLGEGVWGWDRKFVGGWILIFFDMSDR